METAKSSLGSGIVAMVPNVNDYAKTLNDLIAQAGSVDRDTGNACFLRLSGAFDLVTSCSSGDRVFDFATEEAIKSCIFETRDWLATKTSAKFDVISALYKWKLEKFHHRAWDCSMTADNCEGLLFRLMERVCDESQNIAVVQVFLTVQELESAEDSAVRIETRLKDGLDKLAKMVQDNIPLVAVSKAN